MSQVSPTRMNLLQRRGQLRLAQKGVDLLKKKRDALVAEFFGLVREALEARKALNQAAQEAYSALLLAQAFDGPEGVAAAGLGVPPLEGVEAEVENVWGSKVPRLKVTFSDKVVLSPVGTPTYTLEAARAFRRYAEALIQVANTETRLKKIGEEIKKTTRRVNALEQVVIPGIRSQIRFIQQVLEQREREDTFRLKRIKGKIEAREQEAEGTRPNPQLEIGAGL
ncbi:MULTISPECIES: V-type ATP synthase subunit D [Thermus]|uniref:V-type ATP synthase subunit D n=1 Tax=Thermus TaxID=270 RepID=UPI001F3FAEFA|nr:MULTISPECIES: V-type ATP synthase subunit D [Thermus]